MAISMISNGKKGVQMGQIAALSNDIQKVVQYTMNSALKSGRTSIGTAGLWDGVQRFFAIDSSSAGDHKYSKLAADIKGVLGKYGINSDRFNKAVDMIVPGGDELPKNVRVSMDDDATDVFSVLQNQAQTQKRTMEFDDLIAQLFANKSYKLFMVFSTMSENMKADYDSAVEANAAEDQLPPTGFDVNIFYADMQKLLVKTTVREIKSLESDSMAKYLTNINKYVSTRKDLQFIGMDDYVKALEIDLAGRTKRSAVLVGPAGTGKTSAVYELAKRINSGEVNDGLKGSVIYELHMDALVAGKLN
jgi:ATP-dependent Clp protease ATP-binding subunit ClpA